VVCERRDGRGLRLLTRPPFGPFRARAGGRQPAAAGPDGGAGASWPLERSSEAEEVEEDGVAGEKDLAAAAAVWAGAMEARSAAVSASFSKAAAGKRR
jgi:hypothetical protein